MISEVLCVDSDSWYETENRYQLRIKCKPNKHQLKTIKENECLAYVAPCGDRVIVQWKRPLLRLIQVAWFMFVVFVLLSFYIYRSRNGHGI